MLAGQSPIADHETLSAEDRAREAFVFGMRRLQGIDVVVFNARYGVDVRQLFARELAKYVQLGMIVVDDNNVRLTRDGLFVSDAIWPDFLRS